MEMSDSISRDELVVLQLLEEIQQLVDLAGGETKPGEDINPRMHPAAKLYLDTRDTFEVIENLVEEHVKGKPKLLRRLSKQSSSENVGASAPKSSHESPTVSVLNDAVIDRIQEMFRHLGSLLGPSILKELRLRKLSITSILHYVRFLPMEYQWTAYKEARKEEVELVYRETVFNSLSSQPPYTRGATQTLRHRAEFVKHQIRNDVDTVCLFAADGTLSTIFGDDGDMVEENVAIKFESLIADVYSSYLRDSLDVQMKHLTQISDQWAHDTAVTASSKHTAETGPPLIVQCFYRPRKFRMKGGIFPEMLMNLVNRFVHLPPVHSGQQAKLLVADPHHVGVWWQKSIFSVSERDVSTLHDDESRDIFGKIETLDGQLYVPLLRKEQDGSRLFGRSGGLAKWVGQRVLVNNGKDSVWVEVVVVDVDDKRCKLQMKKSLLKCVDVSSWAQFLSLNEWVNLRELHFIGAPVNPHFRVQMGLKFREVVESVQAVVVDISSVFPNGELNDKVGSALWKSVEPSISRGEHIFARYFRSILQHDVLIQVPPTVHSTRARSVSQTRSSSHENVLSAQDNAPQLVVRDMRGSHAVVHSARASSTLPLTKAGTGYFDEFGMYCSRRPSRLGRTGTTARSTISEATAAIPALSPFEKLAHHLLEETEIIGTCIQAQNVALSCAFVQVLLEKIAKMNQQMLTSLQLPSCSVEYVVSEHTNSCRLLFVWRICRHQVDTMARQGRKSRRRNLDDSRYIHLNWVDHAFERVETQILEMMNSLVHYAHRVFFHECMNHLLPGIYEQSWTACKSWFGNTRCTYAVQGFVFRMQLLLEYVNNTVLVGYERNLGVHEKVYELAVRMLLDVLMCIAEAYENLVASRARQGQWKIDILYLVCGVYKLLRQLGQMFSSRGATQSTKGKRKAMNDIRCICLRLLVHLAIRSGPASVVLDTLANKVQADSFEQYADVDTISEMEYHIVSIVQSVDPDGDILGDFGNDESEKELGRIHTVFGSMEIKKLLDVQLNWTALISRSSLPKQTLLGILQQRHELGDWPFPALTEAELQARSRIQQFIDQLSDNTGVSEQEEHDATASEQPSNNTSQDNDNNSHPRDTSGEPSLNLPP
ncbi:hypothetical protein PI125_g2649 [Phytophthora idaei]|nr:hypothetical protein PI125_g2649 [Phytophthora idaei]KAG3171148.1 hypothetical protein PI126_g1981 [Phytophthora idaei]